LDGAGPDDGTWFGDSGYRRTVRGWHVRVETGGCRGRGLLLGLLDHLLRETNLRSAAVPAVDERAVVLGLQGVVAAGAEALVHHSKATRGERRRDKG
jgi:hypothetical protein